MVVCRMPMQMQDGDCAIVNRGDGPSKKETAGRLCWGSMLGRLHCGLTWLLADVSRGQFAGQRARGVIAVVTALVAFFDAFLNEVVATVSDIAPGCACRGVGIIATIVAFFFVCQDEPIAARGLFARGCAFGGIGV